MPFTLIALSCVGLLAALAVVIFLWLAVDVARADAKIQRYMEWPHADS